MPKALRQIVRSQISLDGSGNFIGACKLLNRGADGKRHFGEKREPMGTITLSPLRYKVAGVAGKPSGNAGSSQRLLARHGEGTANACEYRLPRLHLARSFHNS
jgi:hypothetical protein